MFPPQLRKSDEEESETAAEGPPFTDRYSTGRMKQLAVHLQTEDPLELRFPCAHLETGTKFSGGHSISQQVLQNRIWESQVPTLQERLSFLLERLVEFLPRGLIDSINSEILRFLPAQDCRGDRLLNYWLGVYYEFLRRRGDVFSGRLLLTINEKFETELSLSKIKAGWYQYRKQLPKDEKPSPRESRGLLFLGIRRKIMLYAVSSAQHHDGHCSEDTLRTALSIASILERNESYFPQDSELVALSCYTLSFAKLHRSIDWSGTGVTESERRRVNHHRCRISKLVAHEEGVFDG